MHFYEGDTYCGIISLQLEQVYLTRFIYIHTLNRFAMELAFLLFDFPCTRYCCSSPGLSITDSTADTSVWFCGKRLPWTIIRYKNNAYIKVTITPYHHFKVRLFFSSQHLTWLTHLSINTYIHLTNVPDAKLMWSIESIEKYYYYVIANPFQVLFFSYIQVNSSNCKVTFYDGPGILANKTISLDRSVFKTITTTAFSALIYLEKSHSTNQTIHIEIQSKSNTFRPERCIRRMWIVRLFLFASSIKRTQFCYVRISLQYLPEIRKLSVVFSGGSMLTTGFGVKITA